MKYKKITEALGMCCCYSRFSDKVELHEPSSTRIWSWHGVAGGGGRLVKRVGVELVLSLMSFSPFSIPSHSHFCGEITLILLLRSRRSLRLIILVLPTLVLDNNRRGHGKRFLRATKTISYSPGVELILNSLKKLFLK